MYDASPAWRAVTTGTKEAIHDHVARWVADLRAVSGFVEASGSISDKEWEAFIEILDFPQRHPGVHSIGFAEKVTAAFKIIMTDPDVVAIFINIFGGIMKCDTIAEGVIAAVKEVGLKVPLVVRLEGTNVELGKKMLAESKLNIVNAADMADGAQKVVKAAKGGQP